MRLFAALLGFGLLAAGAAAADEVTPSCGASSNTPGCWWVGTGFLPIEDIVKQGVDVVRFSVYRAGASETTVFEVRHAHDGTAVLDARKLDSWHGGVFYRLPQSAWDGVMKGLSLFDQEQEKWRRYKIDYNAHTAERVSKAPKSNSMMDNIDGNFFFYGIPEFCSDSDRLDVETGIGGKMERRSSDSCDWGPPGEIAEVFADSLFSQVPYCARVAKDQRDLCFLLDGNRYTAADAVAAIETLQSLNCASRDAAGFSAVFAPDVSLTMEGELVPARQAAQRYLDMRCSKSSYFIAIDLIEGEPDGDVVVTGEISSERMSAQGGTMDRAPFRQVWRRGGASFRIVSWDIGAPVRDSE